MTGDLDLRLDGDFDLRLERDFDLRLGGDPPMGRSRIFDRERPGDEGSGLFLCSDIPILVILIYFSDSRKYKARLMRRSTPQGGGLRLLPGLLERPHAPGRFTGGLYLRPRPRPGGGVDRRRGGASGERRRGGPGEGASGRPWGGVYCGDSRYDGDPLGRPFLLPHSTQ